MRKIISLLALITAVLLLVTSCTLSISVGGVSDDVSSQVSNADVVSDASSEAVTDSYLGEYSLYGIDLSSLPSFGDKAYISVAQTPPVASLATTTAYETYGELDSLGRCSACISCIGKELMPTEERGSIGQVKPTGWQTVKYDCVDGKYLYNRCHLIGYQLTAENANKQNLITGTRYLNIQGMLPFEDMTADYIKETGNHVMYRVTPIFIGEELLARGVMMEGYSVEDEGDGICFCVFAYNSQPSIEINYADGTSSQKETAEQANVQTYILNTNSHKFHLPTCSGADSISDKNKQTFTGSREDLIAQGYEPCGICNP